MFPPRNPWDHHARITPLLTRSYFARLLRHQRKLRREDKHYSFGIFARATGELVGSASIMDVQRSITQSSYVGYSIFNRHWGRGYAKEAVRSVLDIGFRDLCLHRIEAGVEPGNIRSIRLARKLGMRKEGLKRRMVYLREGWRDLLIYAMTCEEFGVKWRGTAKRVRAR